MINSSNIKVSVITVCLNSENNIKQAIESVLKQTYNNIEYIIVDGGSTDRTLEIIKYYDEISDGKLKWISETDKGIYDAINKGIKISSGEIVGILSSDDWYELDCIEKVIHSYDTKSPYQVIYGMTRIFKNEKEWTVEIVSHNALKEKMMSHEACFITKELYNKYGNYNINYKIVADYDYFLSLYENTEVVFTPVYSLFLNYRYGGVSSSDNTIYENFLVKCKHGLFSKRSQVIFTVWFKIKSFTKRIIRI